MDGIHTFTDLAVGIVGKRVGGFASAGAVHIVYGTGNGLNATGDQVWNQDTSGIAGVAQEDDSLGWALPGGAYHD